MRLISNSNSPARARRQITHVVLASQQTKVFVNSVLASESLERKSGLEKSIKNPLQ